MQISHRSPQVTPSVLAPGKSAPLSGPAPTAPKGEIHLLGLNALRFYAAISVVIAHTDHNFGQMRTQPAQVGVLNVLAMDAQSAVSLFFVLSGFLITYLLLREEQFQGSISVGRFYIRRILRIWPLYYLTVAIGLLLVPLLASPENPFAGYPVGKIFLVLLLLPNFVTGLSPALEHLWSIGLEEQFYLAWPWVVRNRQNLLKVAFGVVFVKILVYPAVVILQNPAMANLYYGLRFECMAIGGMGAYVLSTRHSVLKYLLSVPARVFALGGMVLLVLVDVPLTEPFILTTSGVFVILLLNLSAGPQWGTHLEKPILDSLGRMSYGIYMYHYPLLFLILSILNRSTLPEGPAYTAVLFAAEIAGTLFLAYVSYRWFETPFLEWKDRFARIRSRS